MFFNDLKYCITYDPVLSLIQQKERRTERRITMLKYWVKWECPTEGFYYTEVVTERELLNRINDPTIKIIETGEFIDEE